MTDIVFNPLDPELAVDPFPILARLREHDPVYPAPMGPYIVTAHEPAWEVLRRRDGDLRWEQFQRMRHGDGVDTGRAGAGCGGARGRGEGAAGRAGPDVGWH